MKTLPLLYYPTSVVWVDADASFLASVMPLLDEYAGAITFHDSLSAKAHLESYATVLPHRKLLQSHIESGVGLDINYIRELTHDLGKHHEISVLIIDQNMQGLDGIAFCRSLQHLPIKKMVLTDEKGFGEAANAFNEGWIDCFIKKDNPKLANDISFHLHKLAKQYFIDTTFKFLTELESERRVPLSDRFFCAFFEDWCESNYISEYTIIDQNCNMLVKDRSGNESYFLIHTDASLEAFTELHSNNALKSFFIRAVKHRQKIPFFGENHESWQTRIQDWAGCFYTPETFQGRDKYYYAIIPKENTSTMQLVDQFTLHDKAL